MASKLIAIAALALGLSFVGTALAQTATPTTSPTTSPTTTDTTDDGTTTPEGAPATGMGGA